MVVLVDTDKLPVKASFQLLIIIFALILGLLSERAAAVPLIDFTAPALVDGFGGKESHIYPWGTGADQRRATRSGMGYIVFTGNGRKLTTVSAVFGFTSKETGAINVGGPENFKWFLRIEPITAADAATWYVEQFWNTSTGTYTASTVPGALDVSFTTPTTANSPLIGNFLGINLRKVTVDASSSNFNLTSGQLYRLVLVPWTQEPTPPGCTSANPACVTQLVALPGLSFARSGGINNSSNFDSYYQTLLEYRSYGTSKYYTGTTQWYGGKLTPTGLVGPTGAVSQLPMEGTNWAYDVEFLPSCTRNGQNNGVEAEVWDSQTKALEIAQFKDYCSSRYSKIQWMCDSNGTTVFGQSTTCENGCADGICRP